MLVAPPLNGRRLKTPNDRLTLLSALSLCCKDRSVLMLQCLKVSGVRGVYYRMFRQLDKHDGQNYKTRRWNRNGCLETDGGTNGERNEAACLCLHSMCACLCVLKGNSVNHFQPLATVPTRDKSPPLSASVILSQWEE